MKLNQITLDVSDIAVSKAFYQKLGFRLLVDSPHYCRFLSPEGDATFSIHVAEAVMASSAVLYLETEALDETVKALVARGIAFDNPPQDRPWLWREADLRDPDGHRWKLYWAGENRIDPPWRVKD